MGFRTWLEKKTGLSLKSKWNGEDLVLRDNLYGFLKEIVVKKSEFDRESESVEVVAIGSSHGANSFNPEYITRKSFNLCCSSQYLDKSYGVYEKISKNTPKLDTVVIFLSIFSFGGDTNMVGNKGINSFYKYCYGIEWNSNRKDEKYYKCLLDVCKDMYPKKKFPQDSKLGYIKPVVFSFNNMSVGERFASHYKMYKHDNKPLKHLFNLVDRCKENGHKLKIIFSPVRKSYYELVPKGIFDELLYLNNEPYVEIIDFFNNSPFDDTDFGDHDHMNENGATKLSTLLNKYIE